MQELITLITVKFLWGWSAALQNPLPLWRKGEKDLTAKSGPEPWGEAMWVCTTWYTAFSLSCTAESAPQLTLQEAPLSAATKERPGAAWVWGFSSGWLRAAWSCRQSWSRCDAGARSSSMIFYHQATLKPLQPDRSLPNASEALLPKPRRRLCQEH